MCISSLLFALGCYLKDMVYRGSSRLIWKKRENGRHRIQMSFPFSYDDWKYFGGLLFILEILRRVLSETGVLCEKREFRNDIAISWSTFFFIYVSKITRPDIN